MLDLLQKSGKINIVDKVCYVNQIKKQCGEFSEEKPAFWHTLSALAVLRLFLEGNVKEIIKPIPNFPGYFVSNNGVVMTKKVSGGATYLRK